jgi:hypothetical protein
MRASGLSACGEFGGGCRDAMKSRRITIWPSICVVAYCGRSYETQTVRGIATSRTCNSCRQYLSRLMLSSLTAAPIPPASSNTACHRLLCTTCCCSSGLSASTFLSGSHDTNYPKIYGVSRGRRGHETELIRIPTWRRIALSRIAPHAHVTNLWTRFPTAAPAFSFAFNARAALICIGAWWSPRASTVAPKLKRQSGQKIT